jgi:hypothetical protein
MLGDFVLETDDEVFKGFALFADYLVVGALTDLGYLDEFLYELVGDVLEDF